MFWKDTAVDLALSDHYCVFFYVSVFFKRKASVRTVRTRYLTPEVAANFITAFNSCPPVTLPASCDVIIEHFNSKLQSCLDRAAPLVIKEVKTKPMAPWRNNDEVINRNVLGLRENGGKVS